MDNKLYRDEKSTSASSYMTQLNGWIDHHVLQQPILPSSTTQQQKKSSSILTSRPFRLFVLFYIVFSTLLTAAHFSSWVVFKGRRSVDQWSYQRTYDPLKSYSLISNMSHGLKMSKLFSKGSYEALQYVQPYWQRAELVPNELDVTIVTTTTPDSWKDLVVLAENWNGPISATLHVARNKLTSVKKNIENEYKSKPTLYKNLDLHLIETPQQQQQGDIKSTVLVPLNVERNVARIYARSNHVCDMPLNTIFATDLRSTLLKNQVKFAQLMKKGDMLVVPTFKGSSASPPQTKKEIIGLVEQEKSMGLFDEHFELNQGPTDFEQWKKASQLYTVKQYTMDYEPIVIQSKTVQPWCSERFVDKRSACTLSSYLAGNDFLVLPNDFAIYKSSTKQVAISDLDNVIEKRLYAKFYWEQCVYQGRQLDAMGLWNTVKSDHIRQQCSRVIQNWGRGLIGKPE